MPIIKVITRSFLKVIARWTAATTLARMPVGPMDPTVRWLIQQRLKDGRLPRGRVADVKHGLGDGQECDGCGVTITKDRQGVFAITMEGWHKLRMHRECFDVWESESRAL